MEMLPTQKDNLSNINNLDDLEREIRLVRARIRRRETALGERWKQVPKEAIKSSIGSLIPFFLNNKVAGSTWTLVRDALGFMIGKKTADGSGRLKTMWKDTRQLGLFTLLKAAFSVLKKKGS
jgi:hypothetical protein